MSKEDDIIPFDTDEKDTKNKVKSLNKEVKLFKILSFALLALMIIFAFIHFKGLSCSSFTMKETDILVLKESDVSPIVQMSDIIDADETALSLYSNKKADIPLRSNLNIPEYNGQCLFMNGYAGPSKALGVKIVSVYPNNIDKNLTSVPATMVLVNAETGIVNALIDGTYITRMRTGAVSGLATKLLARKDSKIFGLIGTGGQAITQLEAVLTVRNIEKVYVYDLNYERAKQFAENMTKKFGKKFNVEITAVKTSDEAVENADIITTVTVSKKPVFDGKKVKKNVHINAVGSYTPEMCEIPHEILVNANKIYVDTEHAIKESGDIIQPIQKKLIKKEKITGELGELINGKIKGRENDDEMTYFETTGSAVLDLVAAQKIYEIAKQNKIGRIIDM